MAISHELSSEIAAAILAVKDKSPNELRDLKQLVVKVHLVLQELTTESTAFRYRARLVREKGQGNV